MRNLDIYQEDYGSLAFEDVQSRYRKRRIVQSLETWGARRVLEIGCGTDPIFNHYTSFERCTVVEPASRFADAAIAMASDRRDVRVVRGTLQESVHTLAAENYDFIVLSSLLHELESPQLLLDAVRVLCARDTTVHVNVPNAKSFHRLLAVSMGLSRDPYALSQTQVHMQQHHTFDTELLEGLLSRSGFRVVDRGTFFVKPFTHAQMAGLRAAGLLTDEMLDGLYALTRFFPDNGSEIWMDARLWEHP